MRISDWSSDVCSSDLKFFLGTDSAPHAVERKEGDCGCAGIFNAPFALESYARVFEEQGAPNRLEAFASQNGPRFYGLPLNEGRVALEGTAVTVPRTLPAPSRAIDPIHAGGRMSCRLIAPGGPACMKRRCQ